jgi:deoxycytidine triphosphate deaminase
LILRVGIVSPLPVHDAAYGGNSLLGMTATHRVDVGIAPRMIALQSIGNPIWN